MDVIKKFDAAEEREDVNGMCELCTEDILFENPEWVTKNKADFKMKMKKEFANDTTKFSDVKPWVEDEVGKKYSRTMKVKAMMGLVSIKLQQTYSLNNEGQIKSIIMKKI